jgi:hypothetical protein
LQLCYFAFVVCLALAVDGGGALLQLDSFVADLRLAAANNSETKGMVQRMLMLGAIKRDDVFLEAVAEEVL